MGYETLRSGRRILSVLRDSMGNPKFYEILDTTTNMTRAVSIGESIIETELPEVLEYFLENDQTFWVWPQPANKKLIWFRNAFPWCTPEVGDKLIDKRSNTVFTVTYVPTGRDQIPWNGMVRLDKEPEPHHVLSWMGEAKSRCYVAFKEEDSSADTPTPGEDVDGADTRTAYSEVIVPTIAFLLKTQRPGSIGAKPFGQRVQLKTRLREMFVDPQSPQHSVMVYGWWMDTLIEFTCWHPRTLVSGRLARWFKDFMNRNIPSLKANGINEILFWSQDDVKRRSRGFDAAGRAVQYYFRLEELEVRRESNIRHIDLNIGIGIEEEDAVETIRGESIDPDPYAGSFYDESGNYLPMTLDIADTTGSTQ